MQRQGSVAQLSSSTSAIRKRAARPRSGKSAPMSLVCALALIVHLFFCAPSFAQCVTTTEAFDDPRLAFPTFLRVGDPDGDGPLPEQFLVTQDGLVDKTQIFDGANRTTILNTSSAPIEAAMFQGQWHILRDASPRLSRWDGSALVAIPQIPGSVLSFTEHQGELYFVTALTNGTFQGQIIRWNGVRAEVVGRYTAPSTGVTVTAMASHGTSIYIAANFTAVEGITINGVASFKPFGATGTWTSPTFATSLGSATIRSMASYDGSLYMGTNLSTAGSNFWKLNAASNAWQLERDATTPTRGPIFPTRLIATGGFLYAFGAEGGYTITGGSTTGRGFYRWNGTHWLDMTGLANEWGSLSIRWDSSSIPLVVPYQGQFAFVARISNIYAGDEFALASWDGTRFSLLSKGPNGVVWDMAPLGNDIAVVGQFSHAGGVPVQGTARWDGQTFHPMGATPRPNFRNNSLGIYGAHSMNGQVYISGDFFWATTFNNQCSRLARWNGTDWERAYFSSQSLPGQIFGINSFDSTLVVTGLSTNALEIVNGQYSASRRWNGAMLNHNGNFYVVDGNRLGIRNADGSARWVASNPNTSVLISRLIAFQDEIWAFGSIFNGSLPSVFSSVGRILPNSSVIQPVIGAHQNIESAIAQPPAVYQGDVWWGGYFFRPDSARHLRWNGIEWKRPVLRINGQDIFVAQNRGMAVLRMPRTDGTEELWLSSTNFQSIAFPDSLVLRYRASPPPLLTLQPAPSTACLGETATFTFATQSNEGVTHAWRFNNLVLTDGPVAGLGVVSGARTTQLTISNLQTTTGSIDALATTDCGTSYTIKVPVAPGNTCCDTIDFNNDQLFPTDEDVVDFFAVFAGGTCSNAPNCNDIDFNNDGLFPSDDDLIAFLRVLAGGNC